MGTAFARPLSTEAADEIERLREALKPFAIMWSDYQEGPEGEAPHSHILMGRRFRREGEKQDPPVLTMGDLYRAARVFNAVASPDEGEA
jgi:hypothetical protein